MTNFAINDVKLRIILADNLLLLLLLLLLYIQW
jgi:hypothetical protein